MKFCLWITGLPGSGKSTVAKSLETSLAGSGVNIMTLNMDEVRKIITPEPEYSDRERDILYRSLVYMAGLMVDMECKNVIIDATGNRKEYREMARQFIDNFAEIYVKCPLEICRKREALRDSENTEKDLYKKADAGELKGGLPGVTAPYEETENPELTIHSDILTPSESAGKITEYVRSRWFRTF